MFTVAVSNGNKSSTLTTVTDPTPPTPSERVIIIPKTDRVLADLLAKQCAIKPVGDDWHIRAHTQAEADAIVGMLKLKGVHGILKRPNR